MTPEAVPAPAKPSVAPVQEPSELELAQPINPAPTSPSLPDVTPVEPQSTTVNPGHGWNKLYESHAKRQAAYRQRKKTEAEVIAAATKQAAVENFAANREAGKADTSRSLKEFLELEAAASLLQKDEPTGDTLPMVVTEEQVTEPRDTYPAEPAEEPVIEGALEKENREIAETLADVEPVVDAAIETPLDRQNRETAEQLAALRERDARPMIDWQEEAAVFDAHGTVLPMRSAGRVQLLIPFEIDESIRLGLNSEPERADLVAKRYASVLTARRIRSDFQRRQHGGGYGDPSPSSWVLHTIPGQESF